MELQKEEREEREEQKDNDEEELVPMGQRIADLIADFSGSLLFLTTNLVVFIAWILTNTLIWHVDPFPFQFLTMAVSLEAIFLSIFVLISQNRQTAKDREMVRRDYKSDLHTEQMVYSIEQTVRETANELHQRLDSLENSLEENTRLTQIRRRGKRGNLTLLQNDTQPLDENDEEEETSSGPTEHV